MANYIVSGAAGFIGARVSGMLLEAGHTVIGLDNLNQAYDVSMKNWRLKQLSGQSSFKFHEMDISNRQDMESLDLNGPNGPIAFDAIFNLAARAGVRKSVEDPWVYVDTNITGTLNLLEL